MSSDKAAEPAGKGPKGTFNFRQSQPPALFGKHGGVVDEQDLDPFQGSAHAKVETPQDVLTDADRIEGLEDMWWEHLVEVRKNSDRKIDVCDSCLVLSADQGCWVAVFCLRSEVGILGQCMCGAQLPKQGKS